MMILPEATISAQKRRCDVKVRTYYILYELRRAASSDLTGRMAGEGGMCGGQEKKMQI